MSKFKCPKCGSGDIQKCEMIYMNGTVNHSSTTTVGNYESETSSQASTSLAQSVAPPTKKETYWTATIIAGVITAFAGDAVLNHFQTARLVIAIIAGLFTWACYSMTQEANEYNEKQYPIEYENWQNSYVCFRCGNRFRM